MNAQAIADKLALRIAQLELQVAILQTQLEEKEKENEFKKTK